MLSGSIQIHSSVSVSIKSCNLTIQNFQIFMDDQCNYNTYTCFIYNKLWFIDHPKNTLSYSINHALIKSCISQCSFQFQYFTILNQFNSTHKFNSVLQFNSVLPINSVMPLTNLNYIFYIQDIRVTGTVPLGCRSV